MSGGRRLVLLLVGALALGVLVSLLPQEVLAATLAFLLLGASGILLLVAAALFFLPARRLLAGLFTLPLRLEGNTFGLPPEDELRTTLSPLLAAAIVAGVAALAALLR